jgi:multiple antibiotic resistance protein
MRENFFEFLRTTLLILGALFPIVNPLGNAPVFLTLTREFSATTRAVLARRIAFNGFVLLIASILIGTHILAFFGISLPVVQVAGGMVVLATSWHTLTRDDDEGGFHETRKPPTAADLSQRAFYPLTLPLTVGPGSISVAIAVGANRPQGTQTDIPVLAATVAGAALLAAAVYLSYRFAGSIARLLGASAMNVVTRLSSFILLCIGCK